MPISISDKDINKIIDDKVGEYEAKLRKHLPLGDFVNYLLRSEYANHHILAAVKRRYPDSKATIKTVAGYRKILRKDDKSVPKSVEAKKIV